MKTKLSTDFSVDKENKRIEVKREFAAPLPTVWSAWTESHLLDQWWAPKPWQARTKSMNFTEGGYWLYAMVGPEGEEHWAKADYLSIAPKQSFTALDGFCDAEGVMNEALPRNSWKTTFLDQSGFTLVEVELSFDNLADLETILEMGFKEGFMAALDNLDGVLATT